MSGAPSKDSRPSHSLPGAWTRLATWSLALLLGGIQAAAHPYRFSSVDLISYLDVADAYVHHEWSTAINGYWSPLYSWILALGLSLARPPAHWEFAMVRIVHLVIYLLTLSSFEVFLRRL